MWMLELEELADGTTTALKSTYYVMNNLLRETIIPKGGSDSTSLRKYATNLIYRMLPGAEPFSVSRFISFDLIRVMDNGIGNFPYAPYIIHH
jgi:hypothetical protein